MSIHKERVDAARARSAAMHQYAAAHDSWAEQEQLLALEGRIIEAEGAHQYARMVLRAWIAEKDDPEATPWLT